MTFDGTVDTEGHNVIAPAGVVLSYSGNERAWEYEQVATPAPRGHSPNGGGAGIFEPLEKTVEEKASVHYNTQGTGLVTDDAGAVVGITAVDADGNDLRIKANKGVVVSAGAFTMNDAMLSDYAPYALATSGRTGCQYDDGSGILMGMKVGAATKSLSVPNIQEFIYRFQDMPCGVMVDFRGHRFLGEDWYGTWIGRNVQQHTPDQAYLVVDSVINEHVDDNLGLQQAVLVAQADTVEDLAAQLGIDAGNLQATLDRYNSLVAAGEDTDFHKSAGYLKPVETAPFYAYDFSLAMCGFHTLGGLKINADAQVVDVEGNPIEGLYAAGRSSNGIFGYYPGSGKLHRRRPDLRPHRRPVDFGQSSLSVGGSGTCGGDTAGDVQGGAAGKLRGVPSFAGYRPSMFSTAMRANCTHSLRLPPPWYMLHQTLPNSPAEYRPGIGLPSRSMTRARASRTGPPSVLMNSGSMRMA